MNIRLAALSATWLAYAVPLWAAASSLPAHETYSAATDLFFDSAYTPLLDVTSSPGATAQISGTSYSASASTTLGSNHAYSQASAFAVGAFGVTSFSGWYDQVTITGGTGTGTAYFTVQLNGTVDVGAIAGGMGYVLTASSVHPSQLLSDAPTFNMITTTPWTLDSTMPVASYLIGASPYNDTNILFPTTLTAPPAIPSIEGDPSLLLGDEPEPVMPDLVLTPGAGQAIGTTLYGTFDFTYGEAFYLISGLNTTLLDPSPFTGFDEFCISECPPPPSVDGTGATTLDFSNSANLINIELPEGATVSFASGNAYSVTAVPEPGEWLMMLAGLGLVGWRMQHKTA